MLLVHRDRQALTEQMAPLALKDCRVSRVPQVLPARKDL